MGNYTYNYKRKWDGKVRYRGKQKQLKHKNRLIFLAKLSKIIFLGVILIFISVKVHTILSSSRYFMLTKIEIVGAKIVPTEEVSRTCGVLEGTNIFKIRSVRMERKLENHPWIKRAFVKRRFPDLLMITITERIPIAVVRIGDALLGMDEEGVLLPQIENDAFDNLPVIEGIRNIDEDEKLETGWKLVQRFLNKTSMLWPDLTYVNVSNLSNVELETRRFGTIYLGSVFENNLNNKLMKLEEVLKDIEKKMINVQYIDIRFKNIAVMPALQKEG